MRTKLADLKFSDLNLKRSKKNALRLFGRHLLKYPMQLLAYTYRIKVINGDQVQSLSASKQCFVVAFWHGAMIGPWYHHRHKNRAALVSASKDGDITASILKHWGFRVIRGSSRMGGSEALALLEQSIDAGHAIAITPDGPTGPMQKMKPGAVVLCQRKGVPLFLAGAASNRHKTMRSWDQLAIPKPFSRLVINYSDPIYIQDSCDREAIGELIRRCESQLNELQQHAERMAASKC